MSLPAVTVWSPWDSPRLRYVLDWLLGERLGLSYRLTRDAAEAAASPHCIAYGWLPEAVSLHATDLLRETGTGPVALESREWQGLHTLFFNEESPCDIQFDLFAGIFYLLSRYEEYADFTPDRHGRFPAEMSILSGVLERPVVDEWAEALRLFLEEAWGLKIPAGGFRFRPSYDIDIAWSYQHKGALRTLGAVFRDLASGKGGRLAQRMRVLAGREQDPYNAFIWLAAQHMSYSFAPLWFFLAALRPSRFDKNISPLHPRMAALIRAFSEGAEVGIHPSYYSDSRPALMAEEKATLEQVTGRSITISRQHYIRLRFPDTYRALMAAGIQEDYSMGYSTHLGFRAGTGSTFPWYDLSEERATTFRVHPFAFMDTTGHFDMGLSAEAAFERLYAMAERLVGVHGSLITVFHNFSLGTDPEWAGWRREYEAFLRKMAQF